jgi:hypothetical protein
LLKRTDSAGRLLAAPDLIPASPTGLFPYQDLVPICVPLTYFAVGGALYVYLYVSFPVNL